MAVTFHLVLAFSVKTQVPSDFVASDHVLSSVQSIDSSKELHDVVVGSDQSACPLVLSAVTDRVLTADLPHFGQTADDLMASHHSNQ